MSLFYTSDPLLDFARHDREQAKREEQLPKCDYCNQPIQDERLFDIEGNLYHKECAADEFRRWTEDYIT